MTPKKPTSSKGGVESPRTPTKNRLELASSPIDPFDCERSEPIFSPKIRKSVPSKVYNAEVQSLCDEVKTAKRNFSEISASSSASIQKSKINKGKDSYDLRGFNDFLREEVSRCFEAMLDAMEKEQHLKDQSLRVLVEQWHKGDLQINEAEYHEERDRIEIEISSISSKLVVAKTSKNAIEGYMVDQEFWMRDTEVKDWSYINLLLSRFKPPANARKLLFKSRENDEQERFRARVLKSYNAKVSGDPKSAEWCVVTGGFMNRTMVTAAHIVRYNVGEVSAEHLFQSANSPYGHLMSPENGLPMCKAYEELLDDARIVLVPTPKQESIFEVQIIVLDKSLLEEDGKVLGIQPWGAELDGRILRFPDGITFRPSLKYLYFTYCVNILRRQRHDVPGWWRDTMSHRYQSMWASSGEYLKTSTLKTLAHRIGHLTPEEADLLVGKPEETKSREREEPDSAIRDNAVADSLLANFDEAKGGLVTKKGEASAYNRFSFLSVDEDEGEDEGEDEDEDGL